MESVRAEVDAISAEGQIPSLSVHVRVRGACVLHHTTGDARRVPSLRAATEHQVFDLASVTKALAGATLTSHHLAAGRLRADDPAARWLPGVDPRITVHMLLTHSSGLPAWAPLYASVEVSSWGSATARETVLARSLVAPIHVPGTTHVYSDLGFLWLLQILEHLGGPLDRQLGELLAPAGLGDTVRFDGAGAAATEDCPLRGRVLEGEVHDANCAALGGVSTHAGLFGTARGVARLAEALGSAARGERDDLPSPARLWSMSGPGSHRGGWDGVTPGASSTGGHWPADTVGHLGYTGTCVWMAPARQVIAVLLTNRIHPTDEKSAIRAARPRVFGRIAQELGWRV